MRFAAKTAIVTGAGAGLARTIVLGLAQGGAKVAIADVNSDLLAETAERVCQSGGEVEPIAIDISLKDNCVAIVDRTIAGFGRLDIVVNNAGVITLAPLDQMSQVDWERSFAVNVHAPFYLMQAAMPHLLESHGAVVNVASNAAFTGQAYTFAYCASKTALVNLTESLVMEFIHKPVRINAVAPGAMNTAMASGTAIPQTVDFSLIGRYAPLRPYSEPEDNAAVALFLASDEAKAAHGACFIADQGMMAG